MKRVAVLLSLGIFLSVSCAEKEQESQVSSVSFTPCQQNELRSDDLSGKVDVKFTDKGIQITYNNFEVTCDFDTVNITHTFVNGVLNITQQGSPNQAKCICHTDVSYTITGISKNEVNVIFINGVQVYCYNDDFLQIREKAVDTLTIGSNSFVLDAYLWRDFQPISPENGKPMISINWLINIGMVRIPDNISMVKQYVFYNDDVWIADYENEVPAPSLPEYKIERISRNGPKWGPNIYVDIISQIHDSQSNKDYYIKLGNVYVIRTD